MSDDRMPTIGEDIVRDGRIVGVRITHPAGVGCSFAEGTCSCGRLELGLLADDIEGTK